MTGQDHASSLLCAVAVACGSVASSAAAATITQTSGPFSLGFGATEPDTTPDPGTWTTNETNAANTPPTTGNANRSAVTVGANFKLTPSVSGNRFSGRGPEFPARVLTNGRQAQQSGTARTFEADLLGEYTGTLPSGATNVQTTLNVSDISIYGIAYVGGSFSGTDPDNFHFNETTPGNTASSPDASTLSQTSDTHDFPDASNFTQLSWDPSELAVAGQSADRTFHVTGFNDSDVGYALDGFEVEGTITTTYDVIPEPATSLLLVTGLAGLTLSRRRRGSQRGARG